MNKSYELSTGMELLDKPDSLDDLAQQINEQHGLACLRAGEAVHHAAEAGKLLLTVKATLPHGEFGQWLEVNIAVTPRQVQRYMRAAQGKPTSVRKLANTTSVSYLTDKSTPSKVLQIAVALKSTLAAVIEDTGCKTVDDLVKLLKTERDAIHPNDLMAYDQPLLELRNLALTLSNALLQAKLNACTKAGSHESH